MKKKIYFISIVFLIFIIFSIILFYKKFNDNENIYDLYRDTPLISSYNNPIVPEGFKTIETETASWELKDNVPKGWNNGLVIEDQKGNQFVWVPVNFSLNTLKQAQKKENYIVTANGKILSEQEILQLLKYQGFYVSRYEAGLAEEILESTKEFSVESNNIEGIPVSKKGQIVWNYIDWNTAKINSQNMYNTNNIKSNLITFNEWEYILEWLTNNNIHITDSSAYGNYSNSSFYFSGLFSEDYGKTYKYTENMKKTDKNIILSTGISKEHCTNNIYDLAGNVAEYTDVIYSINGNDELKKSYSCMGGYYDNIGSYSISTSLSISTANSHQGFRIVLYQ